LISIHSMYNVFTFIELVFGSYPFLMAISSISLVIKIYILRVLLSQKVTSNILLSSRNYLLVMLIGALTADIAWILLSIREYLVPEPAFIIHAIILFFIRSTWIFFAIEYQALALFIENLITPSNPLSLRQKVLIFTTSCFAIFFLYASIASIYLLKPSKLMLSMHGLFAFYAIFVLMGFSTYSALKKLKTKKVPRILAQQLLILIKFLIVPRLISDFIQYYPFHFFAGYFASCYSIIGISTTLLTFALYFCARKIMGLRFLNFQSHVQDHRRFNFIDRFKDTLEELAKTSTVKELGHINQTFFKEAFGIPHSRIGLYIRTINLEGASPKLELSQTETLAETFLSIKNVELERCINKVKILIYDEIEFNNFYDPNEADTLILKFMDSINSDIFLPIYKNQSIIGYIIVERHARLHEFYTQTERDEMLIFASYLGNIINLLQNRNLETLIYQEKELKEELYKKHQEINQYKESIHSFLKNNKHKDIGIIFYKQRHFIFANQAAKEIIKININTNQGSPLTKALKTIAQQVEEYKSPQSCIAKNSDGERIVISGVPNLEKNHVIITVYYPDFSDIIARQINLLKDPTLWDYLLYLETTKPGMLINQLIPGSGEQLLAFKINLLQASLTKKALLLEMATDDLLPTVELLHHISMRTTLHVLTLQGPCKGFDIAIKLFGINPIFGHNPEHSKPLLEKLDGNGTLFIQNIECIDLETQEYLAEFIKYGYYRIFKSSQKMQSNVRLICSTNHNLQTLVHEGSFSSALFNELKKTSLSMPSLLTLPDNELTELAQSLAEQSLKTDDFKNVLDLNPKDKYKIVTSKPASLVELKTRVQQLLAQKSKHNAIDHEVQFNPAYDTSDPDLILAARLGKHALRDQRIMTMLWNKFKNQNKIATFLGVNRSSINRRCKEYNLE
jgi:transcriptional regulator with GAF, ATPase, and Fis domain